MKHHQDLLAKLLAHEHAAKGRLERLYWARHWVRIYLMG